MQNYAKRVAVARRLLAPRHWQEVCVCASLCLSPYIRWQGLGLISKCGGSYQLQGKDGGRQFKCARRTLVNSNNNRKEQRIKGARGHGQNSASLAALQV